MVIRHTSSTLLGLPVVVPLGSGWEKGFGQGPEFQLETEPLGWEQVGWSRAALLLLPVTGLLLLVAVLAPVEPLAVAPVASGVAYETMRWFF